MWMMQVTLEKKVTLTRDVFELHYRLPETIAMLPGQFFTFILPGIGWRAYSALDIIDNTLILIIKRWSEADGGRGWSRALCDASIWEVFKLVGPAWHFVLQENTENKLFLWTGTWLVPLYNMILAWLAKKSWEKYQLVFWVRYISDMFYIDEFAKLKQQYPEKFYYHLVVSRSEWEGMIKKWYVTDFLSQKVVQDYGEFYICWAPDMIEWCQLRLGELWVDNEKIYFEKYS